MADSLQQPQPPEALAQHVARLDARLARIEAQLGLAAISQERSEENNRNPPNEVATHVDPCVSRPIDDELERQIGQPAFSLAGVIALTSGLGFLLSLQHPNLPPAAPGIIGIALAAALLLVAHILRRAALLGSYVRGAAMLLLYFAALRFFFLGRVPAVDLDSVAGRTLLGLATLINAALAWRSRSRWLALLVVLMGCATGLTASGGIFVLIWLPLIAAAAVLTAWRWNWPGLLPAAISVTHLGYFLWAIGNPIFSGKISYAGEQPAAPGTLMAMVCFFAAGSLCRPNRDGENGVDAVAALLNCAFGYSGFLVHTAARYSDSFVALHTAAFAIFLSIAVLFRTRERSDVSTFYYAIAGYVALSMAIIKAAPSPHVFVWLSGQSLVVLATAIWFHSRLIVVANFLIYAVIVVGYVFFVQRETGVSIGFGLVALVSARLLNWQRERLELKTELMRNAYLLSAFLVLPYALQHLVPPGWVGLAWIGLAVGYYALNRIVRNQKYRWMGHATLGLTALFLILAGPGRLEPAYRVASFLVLGTVLLVVSLRLKPARR